MDWQEEYKRKLVTAEEAVSVVKSGDRVAFALGSEPEALCEALAARLGDLKDVDIYMSTPATDWGWFQPGWEESFKVTIYSFVALAVRQMTDEKRADYVPILFSTHGKAEDEGRPGTRGTDVFMTIISPPDKNGFCSFGASLWNKKQFVKTAKISIAQVDRTQIRTYGENYIHVSEFDYFVEHDNSPREYVVPEPDEMMKTIGQYVKTLVRDGDTIAIGAGSIGSTLPRQGIFDDKHDLGYHAENIVPGIVRLVKMGVMTGKRKTIHTGKVVCNNLAARDPGDLAFIDMNPMFECYPQQYVINIRTVAAHDNMVPINGALSVDLTGQIASESIGPRMWSGTGGQSSFAIGAILSKGGRSIMMLPSTANTPQGKVSRITPFLEPGTIVTIPRNYADYIVTEYGVASLLEKSQRERAQELIAIAHPDFRAELKKTAQKLFWP